MRCTILSVFGVERGLLFALLLYPEGSKFVAVFAGLAPFASLSRSRISIWTQGYSRLLKFKRPSLEVFSKLAYMVREE
jgi:hypothetical protein